MIKIFVKKVSIIIYVLILCTGCDKGDTLNIKEDQTQDKEELEIALIADLGTIEDQSFNEANWEGIEKYAKENNKTYGYYQPEEGTQEVYLDTIAAAVENGAKIIVCPGYLFETPVYQAQTLYPDVNFILVDGKPYNAGHSDDTVKDNVAGVLFKEEEAGFLAGYAAVMDGNKELGFVGGMAVPAVIRYGYGYVQGADYAAEIINEEISINYTYSGTFRTDEKIKELTSSWYQSGTEVIFSCGGGIITSVLEGTDGNSDYKVIGVDVDQSKMAENIMTSAMKMISPVVYELLEDYYEGTFPGGEVLEISVVQNGVGLPMETSQFNDFSEADYNEIYNKLKENKIVIYNSTKDSTTQDLELKMTKVNYIY